MSWSGKKCWIIGASTGIGAALAAAQAVRGAQVAISARRETLLSALTSQFPSARAIVCDVNDPPSLTAAAEKLAADWGHIDSVIVMAAIYEPMPFASMDMPTAANIVHTNVTGTLNCVHAILPHLRAQGAGQLALCGSVAGYRGLPNAQPYAATKAAVISIAESLRAEEGRNGIDVRVINPGFVETPMTSKNKFPMPFLIVPEEAAQRIITGLEGKSFEIDFPKRMSLAMKLLRLMPDWIFFTLMKKMALLAVLFLAATRPAEAAAPFTPAESAYSYSFTVNGKPLSLRELKGHVLLIVNTASECGFTPQYEGLEKLYKSYKDRGLIVIAVPSNDFGGQEPGTNAEIVSFTRDTYNVTFPVTEKEVVTGDHAHPFYIWAAAQKKGGVFTATPRWNFHKYLVGKDGRLIDSFASYVEPGSKDLVSAIDKALTE